MSRENFGRLSPLAWIAALVIVSAACGNRDDGNDGSGGTGATASIDPMQPGMQPPAPNGGNQGAGTVATVLAIRRLRLGDVNATGNTQADAWASQGYNLDGLVSTRTGSNHCNRQPNAPAPNQEDGIGGIDNSFGKNINPILQTFSTDPSGETSARLEQGGATVLLKLHNLDASANQKSIQGSVYEAAPVASVPLWNGADVRPVLVQSVNNNDVNDPRFKFSSSYVTSGTWVSAGEGSFSIVLEIGGTSLSVRISRVLITMKVQGPGAAVHEGMIAGVIETEAFANEFRKFAGYFTSGQLCPGNQTLESAMPAIYQASDIMADGTNGDPNRECNAISVGLAFDATPVQLGGIAAPNDPPPDPCVN
jgi:hypothetical protein